MNKVAIFIHIYAEVVHVHVNVYTFVHNVNEKGPGARAQALFINIVHKCTLMCIIYT